MPKVICEREELVSIADAIRSKFNINKDLSLAEMRESILAKPQMYDILIDNRSPEEMKVFYLNENNELNFINWPNYQSGSLKVPCSSKIYLKIETSVSGGSDYSFSYSEGISTGEFGSWEKIIIYIPSTPGDGYFYLNWSDCCFIPGTQIQTSLEGTTKSIEELKENDDVVAYNIFTKEYYIAKVKKLIINRNTTDIAEVYFDNNSNLTMNAYHPIYTENGFHSLTGHNGYEELKVGDIVRTNEGWTTITEIKRYKSEPIITYNLDVIDNGEEHDDEENDTFIANGIVVHNATSCPT